jgi:hypothetical protein
MVKSNDAVNKLHIIFIITAALLMRKTALAETSFHPEKVAPLNGLTNLECAIVREVPRSSDTIYKIVVKIALDDSLNVEDLSVVHHGKNGETYNRAEQYKLDARVTQIPDHADFTWSGLRSDHATKMEGRLVRLSNTKWEYYETLSKHGRFQYAMKSVCHDIGPVEER